MFQERRMAGSMKKRLQSLNVAPVKVKIPNGMTIITKENHSTPIVSFCVYFPGGVFYEDKSNMGITYLMQRLLIKGTKNRNARQIADEIEFLGAYLSPFTGKEALGISMSSVSKHFWDGVKIFVDCIMNPLFDERELEKEKRNILIEIDKRKDDVLNYCLEICDEKLFENNPYGNNVIGTKESVSKISREDIVRWHRYFYKPENMVIALVGDIQAKIVENKFLKAFDDFKSYASMPEIGKNHFIEPEMEKKLVIEKREKKQVTISLGFIAPSLKSPLYFPFKVLDYLLSGMGSRLFISLRDTQGLAYLVNSSYTSRKYSGNFKTYMQTSIDKKEKALDGLLKELNLLKKDIPPEEEIERVKMYMLGLNEISMQKKWAQASKLAFYELMDLGYDFLDRYPGLIKKVKPIQVLDVARTYLDTEKFTCSMILPKD